MGSLADDAHEWSLRTTGGRYDDDRFFNAPSLMINDHLRREGKLMLAFPAIVCVIALLAALVLPPILQWIEVDDCLDRGGAFDRERGVCVYVTTPRPQESAPAK
jgi:hypothetical protein